MHGETLIVIATKKEHLGSQPGTRAFARGNEAVVVVFAVVVDLHVRKKA